MKSKNELARIKKKTKSTPHQKRGRGRPSKYTGINLKQIERLASLGLIDTEIADVVGISKQTLNKYKKKPEFLDSIKRGKIVADVKVIQSLFKRSIGYKEKDIYWSTYKGEATATPYEKNILPDVVACIFWLKNRRPQDWRDRQDMNVAFDQQQLNEVMAAYAEAFVAHPGSGMVAIRDKKMQGESS